MFHIFYVVAILSLQFRGQDELFSNFEITFPTASLERPNTETLKPTTQELKAVEIEGVLVYYISLGPPHLVSASSFDNLKPGLTLKELMETLGPGYQSPLEGVGFIYWKCEDGRILNVMPDKYQLNEKPRYWIDVFCTNQNHVEIRKLAHEIIKGVQIKIEEVSIVLSTDTPLVEAGELRTYRVGDCFQKVTPLPRIDFCIRKIEAQSIHCEYFYQAAPKGINHVFDRGWVIVQKKRGKK